MMLRILAEYGFEDWKYTREGFRREVDIMSIINFPCGFKHNISSVVYSQKGCLTYGTSAICAMDSEE